jgi:ribosomal-protein-alanine N-acetyltransferase
MKPDLHLHTDRLTLSPFEASELEVFIRINTDPFVRRFVWDGMIMSDEVLKEVFEKSARHFANDRWGLWKMVTRDTNTLVGYAGLWPFYDEPQPQLMYILLEEHTGRGYATEASRRIIDYAFQELKFTYLTASLDTPNTASQRVCERLNFTLQYEKLVNGNPLSFYKLTKA